MYLTAERYKYTQRCVGAGWQNDYSAMTIAVGEFKASTVQLLSTSVHPKFTGSFSL
jgi:hypothetical protein